MESILACCDYQDKLIISLAAAIGDLYVALELVSDRPPAGPINTTPKDEVSSHVVSRLVYSNQILGALTDHINLMRQQLCIAPQ